VYSDHGAIASYSHSFPDLVKLYVDISQPALKSGFEISKYSESIYWVFPEKGCHCTSKTVSSLLKRPDDKIIIEKP